jgi:hypothetical protein
MMGYQKMLEASALGLYIRNQNKSILLNSAWENVIADIVTSSAIMVSLH